MKYQVYFSLKNNKRYSRLSSDAVVIGALRVNAIRVLKPFNHLFSFRFSTLYFFCFLFFFCFFFCFLFSFSFFQVFLASS